MLLPVVVLISSSWCNADSNCRIALVQDTPWFFRPFQRRRITASRLSEALLENALKISSGCIRSSDFFLESWGILRAMNPRPSRGKPRAAPIPCTTCWIFQVHSINAIPLNPIWGLSQAEASCFTLPRGLWWKRITRNWMKRSRPKFNRICTMKERGQWSP